MVDDGPRSCPAVPGPARCWRSCPAISTWIATHFRICSSAAAATAVCRCASCAPASPAKCPSRSACPRPAASPQRFPARGLGYGRQYHAPGPATFWMRPISCRCSGGFWPREEPRGSTDHRAKAVGFRNVAVHNYEAINWEIVFAICSKFLSDFQRFVAEVTSRQGLRG